MTPDSSSAAPSLESLRQQWRAKAESHANNYGDLRFETLCDCADALQPHVDHERSLVAEIQRLKAHAMPDGLRCVDLGECLAQHETAERAEAEIQRLTDALTRIKDIWMEADMRGSWRSDALKRIGDEITDALPETPHEKSKR